MINPYQSPFPDEFLDENIQEYAAAIETLEGTIVGLRDWIWQLERENEKLKGRLRRLVTVLGFHLESADID